MHPGTRCRVLVLALAAVAAGCAESHAPVPAWMLGAWVSVSVDSTRTPVVIDDNAATRIRLIYDWVQFGGDGMALRRAGFEALDKATGLSRSYASEVRVPYWRDGPTLRVVTPGSCTGLVPCPEWELGVLRGDTLLMPSRFAHFRTVRFHRQVFGPD